MHELPPSSGETMSFGSPQGKKEGHKSKALVKLHTAAQLTDTAGMAILYVAIYLGMPAMRVRFVIKTAREP